MVDKLSLSEKFVEELRLTDSFGELIREELILQLNDLDETTDAKTNWQMREAFHRVIAYNSVPGTYKEGIWDGE